MDLPGFSVMPAGLDDWEPIWKRRPFIPSIIEPRLLNVVRLHLGPQVDGLRPFPWQPKKGGMSKEGDDLGIPSRVFPQWFRCTGCDFLGPLPRFSYTNTHPFRPDLAQFTHKNCPGRGGQRTGSTGRKRESPAVTAQHLLTCTNGHLDEFPYALWVHRGGKCPKAELPDLKMRDANVGKSVGSTILCASCGATRGMAEAQGRVGRDKLPQKCRGRHPHLNAFDAECDARPALIMMGASNLWFASTQSIIVMPRTDAEEKEALADQLRVELGVEQVQQFGGQVDVMRALGLAKNIDMNGITDDDIIAAVADVLAPADSEEERQEKLAASLVRAEHVQRDGHRPARALDQQPPTVRAVAGHDPDAGQLLVAAGPLSSPDDLRPGALRRVGVGGYRVQHAPRDPIRPARLAALEACRRHVRRREPGRARCGDLDVEDAGPLRQPQARPVQAIDERRIPVLVDAAPARAAQPIETVATQPDIAPLLERRPQHPLDLPARRASGPQRIPAHRLATQPLLAWRNAASRAHAGGSDRIGHAVPLAGPRIEAVQRRPVRVEARRLHPPGIVQRRQPPLLERFHVTRRRLHPPAADHVQVVQPHHHGVGIPAPRSWAGLGHRPGAEEQIDPRVRPPARADQHRGPVPSAIGRSAGMHLAELRQTLSVRRGHGRSEVVERHRPPF
nr:MULTISPECIES: DrmB family protein [unclassified Nocardioides]